MNADDIVAEVQILQGKDKLKARADVLIPLGTVGLVQLLGCSVAEQQGQSLAVFLPSRKGKKEDQYFDCVRLLGPVRQLVTQAVLREYQRQLKAGTK
jgi:DNA-binding cell septation regulator SpoVG